MSSGATQATSAFLVTRVVSLLLWQPFVLLRCRSIVRLVSANQLVCYAAVMAAQQVSAGLSAPRIFKQTTVKTNKAPQSFGPLHRAVSRTHNFAFNPAIQGPEVTPAPKFVRPDCPPDVSETAVPNGLSQDLTSGSRNAAKQVRNSARSALEQVRQSSPPSGLTEQFVFVFVYTDIKFGCVTLPSLLTLFMGLQVSFFTNNKLQEEKRSNSRFGIFGF